MNLPLYLNKDADQAMLGFLELHPDTTIADCEALLASYSQAFRSRWRPSPTGIPMTLSIKKAQRGE